MIFEWIFGFLIFYFLYKLIFDFILPVSRATSQVRNKINEMHRQQPPQASRQNTDFNQADKNAAKPAAEDYIDFEEIK